MMQRDQDVILAHEINLLKRVRKIWGRPIDVPEFMNAMMRGGLHDIITHNGGKFLRFSKRSADGELKLLREFYIPLSDNPRNSLRGFVLTSDDGIDTIDLRRTKTDSLNIERELLKFFSDLYSLLAQALEEDDEIAVSIQSSPASQAR